MKSFFMRSIKDLCSDLFPSFSWLWFQCLVLILFPWLTFYHFSEKRSPLLCWLCHLKMAYWTWFSCRITDRVIQSWSNTAAVVSLPRGCNSACRAEKVVLKSSKLLSLILYLSFYLQLGNLERKWQHLEQNNFAMKECILFQFSRNFQKQNYTFSVMINDKGIYHGKYSIRNSLYKIERIAR